MAQLEKNHATVVDLAPLSHSNYKPSVKSIFSIIPASWAPYARLWRLDSPAGYNAIFLPYPIGLGLGACIAKPAPSPTLLLFLLSVFSLGSVFLRGAGCTWNDIIDQDIDRKVKRTRNRPIARGVVSTKQALVFLAATTVLGSSLLALLPTGAAVHAIPTTVLSAIYPFAKRVTYYPQFVLGLALGWGVLMAAVAAGGDLRNRIEFGAIIILFSAVVLWTMTCDMIYAHQDAEEDAKVGVKSMAVRFAEDTKLLALVLSFAQVGLLVFLGWFIEMDAIYYAATCGGTAVSLASMIILVDLRQPNNCAVWFYRGLVYVGLSMASGFFATYFVGGRYFR
ncbi:putative 4-hydroxybenzoate polyprenyl transferase [Pseudomassariella vexata]|uniref:4-hydroxybenzoate polyprenyltransferase, mitochondrial n=1 Tax=Pseudomassariella vexata TaxID=1141098 RepID=A0A1Y2DXE3_9PEZI|nr:putative 4-hydroxybenzoate polyprenyl transferase [Pseudomassariella vexata]ORY63295.1 putative 4-hydroxybenzoate polyprenyl transferase [Pseudomassariella vexata]